MSKYYINPGEPIQAVLHTIRPGDEVYIMPGVYSEKINIPVSGTADAPILIKSYEKHGAIFDGAPIAEMLGSRPMVQCGHTSALIDHITFEGFELKNAPKYNFWGQGRFLEILSIHSHHNNGGKRRTGATGIQLKEGDHSRVAYCLCHDTGWNGIASENADNVVFEYNIIKDCPYHNGLDMKPMPYIGQFPQNSNIIRYNEVDNIGQHGIYTRYFCNGQIVGNLVQRTFFGAIEMTVEDSREVPTFDSYSIIKDNTCIHNQPRGWGFRTQNANHLTVRSNRFFNNGHKHNIIIGGKVDKSTIEVVNNLQAKTEAELGPVVSPVVRPPAELHQLTPPAPRS
jgi:hypothetical protein